jgi:hypothetical protein
VVVYLLQWYCISVVVLHSLQWCYIDCAGAILTAKKLSNYPVFPLGQIGRGVKLNTLTSYSARLRVNDGSDLDKLSGALGE